MLYKTGYNKCQVFIILKAIPKCNNERTLKLIIEFLCKALPLTLLSIDEISVFTDTDLYAHLERSGSDVY